MIPRLVELYKQGKFPVDQLCKVYPAERIDQALDDLKSGKVSLILSLKSLTCAMFFGGKAKIRDVAISTDFSLPGD
jgi:hypothetical protein